jgi:hypothetical protein
MRKASEVGSGSEPRGEHLRKEKIPLLARHRCVDWLLDFLA